MTIEQGMEKALFDTELIPKCNYGFFELILRNFQFIFLGELKKSGWKRAARTDKGVHAIANVVNCKLAIKKDYIEEVEEEPKESQEPGKEKLTKVGFKSRINFKKLINTLNSNLKDIKIFGKLQSPSIPILFFSRKI